MLGQISVSKSINAFGLKDLKNPEVKNLKSHGAYTTFNLDPNILFASLRPVGVETVNITSWFSSILLTILAEEITSPRLTA
jgi:hypothetical protein